VDLGHHKIFDHYRRDILNNRNLKKTKDEFHWHYHHMEKSGSWGWSNSWLEHDLYEKIISRKIYERNFYPAIYCAGGYFEDNESSMFLEKWIPFDVSSNSPIKTATYDWSRAPIEWSPYHPAKNDYQKKGEMRRWLLKRRPVAGFYSKLNFQEIEDVFKQAERGKRPIFSVISHDYCATKRNEFEFLFHATSPEQATSTAREIIKHHQAEAISLI